MMDHQDNSGKIKYSVIIPVYNAEKTLRRCLDSLLSQQYDGAEYLLVNDGSRDGSGSICSEFARQNDRVRYFEQENCGVSSARNTGLDHASGEYVLFVDSDDYVTPAFFSEIDAELERYDYDLIQFSNYFVKDQVRTARIRTPFRATTRRELFPMLMETLWKKKSNQPWAKVYRRALIEAHHIRFPLDMEVGEDRAFYIHYSYYMSSLCISEVPLYCVSVDNADSLSRKYRRDLDAQTARLNAYAEIAAKGSGISPKEWAEYQKALHYDQLRMVYAKAKTLHKEQLPLGERLRAIRGYCRQLNRERWDYPGSLYCRLTSLPVRWNLALVIDTIAWKLTH